MNCALSDDSFISELVLRKHVLCSSAMLVVPVFVPSHQDRKKGPEMKLLFPCHSNLSFFYHFLFSYIVINTWTGFPI